MIVHRDERRGPVRVSGLRKTKWTKSERRHTNRRRRNKKKPKEKLIGRTYVPVQKTFAQAIDRLLATIVRQTNWRLIEQFNESLRDSIDGGRKVKNVHTKSIDKIGRSSNKTKQSHRSLTNQHKCPNKNTSLYIHHHVYSTNLNRNDNHCYY